MELEPTQKTKEEEHSESPKLQNHLDSVFGGIQKLVQNPQLHVERTFLVWLVLKDDHLPIVLYPLTLVLM